MKRRWKFTLLAIVGLGIAGVGAVLHKTRNYSVDQSVIDVTSFTYDFLARAARDSLGDVLDYSPLPLAERAEAACLSLGLRTSTGEAHCPRISVRQGGSVGTFMFSDANGELMVTDDLIMACGDDPAMLAGVIAHELGHSAHLRQGTEYQYWSHSKRRILAQVHGTARIKLLWEDFEDAADQILESPYSLIDYAFTPEEEAAANAYAAQLLEAADFPTDGFQRCLRTLRESPDLPGAPALVNSHPSKKPGSTE